MPEHHQMLERVRVFLMGTDAYHHVTRISVMCTFLQESLPEVPCLQSRRSGKIVIPCKYYILSWHENCF